MGRSAAWVMTGSIVGSPPFASRLWGACGGFRANCCTARGKLSPLSTRGGQNHTPRLVLTRRFIAAASQASRARRAPVGKAKAVGGTRLLDPALSSTPSMIWFAFWFRASLLSVVPRLKYSSKLETKLQDKVCVSSNLDLFLLEVLRPPRYRTADSNVAGGSSSQKR